MRNLFRFITSWLWPKQQPAMRSFSGAAVSRLTNDWSPGISTPDAELHGSLVEMRKRSRDLERNNDFVRRYLKLLENNVLGANGIQLQMKVRERKQIKGVWTETYDTLANSIIEEAWWRWTRPIHCHIGGQLSFFDLCVVALRSTARDGAILFRKHYTVNGKNGFALEPLEADHLDTDHNYSSRSDGSYISLGVEYSDTGKVVAYHLLRNHPGDGWVLTPKGKWRERVPANRILHLFKPERFGQSTGFPWIASGIMNLRHLEKYIEAEVVAARVAAAKMGFLVPGPNAPPVQYTGETDANGAKYMEVDPGSIEKLPLGWDFKSFDPTHPNAIFPEFVKAQLRSIAAGLGVSYTSLANDLEGVNYSSIRAGLLEEREEWKALQRWFIDWFITPIFEEWLQLSLGSEALPLPLSKFDKFNMPEWKARRWAWTDPLKDIQASVIAIEKGLASRRSIIAEGGGDVEDTFADIAADNKLADDYGLDFPTDVQNQSKPNTNEPPEDDKS